MDTLPADTSPEAEQVLLGLLREVPPWRKMKLVAGMNSMVRALALSGLRARHPDASSEELRRRLADILLGSELAAKAYGPMDEGGSRSED